MVITMNIECSPAEARRFLGLPDAAAMQEELLQEYRDRMVKLDPEELMKSWNSATGGSWEEMQKTFLSHFAGTPPKE